MPVNDIYQARIVCDQNDQTSINVVHYYTSAETGAGASPGTIATALDAAIEVAFKATLNQGAIYHGVGITKIKPVRGVEFESVVNKGPGTSGPDALPTQVAGLCSVYANIPGRSGRGRIYYPFPATTMAGLDGKMLAAYKTLISASAAQIFFPLLAGGGGNTTTIAPCIYHKKTGTFSQILNIVPDLGFATQRRRGEHGRTNLAPW